VKRLILLLLLAAVAFAGYRYYATSIAPERRYKEFAEEVLHQHYDAAAAMADGAVVLHAAQTVLFNPAGVESAVRPAMYATMNQTVTLRKTAGGWKVAAFENKFGKMDSLTGR
jgi:hypothetical protein